MASLDRLIRVLDRLSASEREVLHLRHEVGWTLHAIAQKRDESPVEVAATLLAAAQRIQAELSESAQE